MELKIKGEVEIRHLTRMDFKKGFRKVLKIINPAKITPHDMYKLIVKNNTEVFVAEVDDKIVGTLTLIFCSKFGGTLGLIEDVAVLRKYERRGVGSALVKYALRYADFENCYKVILTCKNNNINFYENNGMSKYQNCMVKKFVRL